MELDLSDFLKTTSFLNAIHIQALVSCLDNTSIHHHPVVRRMCETHGVRVIYLPPYSPDYNPVEEFFSVLKKWLKRYYEACGRDITFEEFLHMGVEACHSELQAKAHFRHAGIQVH